MVKTYDETIMLGKVLVSEKILADITNSEKF